MGVPPEGVHDRLHAHPRRGIRWSAVAENDKPSIAELIERVDVLEEALERMLAAFKEDLGTLRRELRRLDPGHSTVQPHPAARPSTSTQRVRPSGPTRTISEELAVHGKKRDPRADD